MATTSEARHAPVIEDAARTREEEGLARSAAAGDGAAFATLYDRYERRIFNYCLRLLTSSDDAADATQEAFLKVLQRLPKLGERELNFSAYLYTAARNASYDMIGRRKKAEPVEEIPELAGVGAREPGAIEDDPERAALLDSFQADVQDANARLPERHREVLALREVEELSYDEIAEIMDMNRNSVAQLISRARIKLRDELRGTALGSVAVSSTACEKALPLISMRQDGQLKKGEDREWLDAHLATCATCKVSVEAIEEAGVSYRAWLPIVPLEWLRQATIAKASELVGADWSELAETGRSADADADADGDHPEDGGGSSSSPNGSGAAPHDGGSRGLLHLPASWRLRSAAEVGAEDSRKRRKRGLLLGVIAGLLLLVGATAVVVGSDDTPAVDEPVGGEPVGAATGDGGSGNGDTATGGGSAGAPAGDSRGGAPGKDDKGATTGLSDVPFLPGVKIRPGGGTTTTTGTGSKPGKRGTKPGRKPSSNSGGGNGGGGKTPSRKPARNPSSNGGGGNSGAGDPNAGNGGGDSPSAVGPTGDATPPSSDPTPPSTSDPTPPSSDPPARDPGGSTPGSINNGGGGSTTPSRTPSTTPPPSTRPPSSTRPCRTPSGAPC